jgi:hypothetical protein
MKTKPVFIVLLVVLILNACAPSAAPVEETPAPILTGEPLPIPTQTDSSPQPRLPVAPAWKAVRDARYGFGLAVPCWWLVSPIPEQGFGGAMTITNYDEAYFMGHSNKGYWEWPNGTLKLDLVVMVGIDPAKSDADAYMGFVDPTMTGLVSAEQQQIGQHTVTVLTLANLINAREPHTRVFIHRLAPDKLLMVAPIPQTIIEAPDFQAVLASIVLTPDEQIALPSITPAPALIDAPCAP